MATTKTETEPTPTETPAGATPAATVDAELEAVKAHAASLTVEDPEQVQERILRSMLGATNPHDLLTAGAATPASDIYGVPLTVTAIRASESDFTDGADLYLHIEVTTKQNGDRLTVSCGARDVCAKLVLADMRGWLPMDCVIEQSAKPTKDGFYPVFLRPVDAAGEPF